MEGFIILVVFILVVVTLVLKAIVLVPQGEAAIVERLGRYTQTLNSGLNFIIPIIDRVREKVDTRERMVTFPPQAVITEDNLTVAIDTVVTFQVNEPDRAIYGIDDYIFGVEQITTATLRDVVGGLTLEETLTSRDYINRRLRGELLDDRGAVGVPQRAHLGSSRSRWGAVTAGAMPGPRRRASRRRPAGPTRRPGRRTGWCWTSTPPAGR